MYAFNEFSLESIYYSFKQNCNQTITFVNLCCFCRFANLFAARSHYLFQGLYVYNYNFSDFGISVHVYTHILNIYAAIPGYVVGLSYIRVNGLMSIV